MNSPEPPAHSGTVTHIEPKASCVAIHVQLHGGEPNTIDLDIHSFVGLLDAEASNPSALIGRRAAFDGKALWFIGDAEEGGGE